MSLTDEELLEAAPLARARFFSALPNPDECNHQFSHHFERRMRVLLRRQKHQTTHRIAQRAAAVFLAVLIGTGVWLAVDTDARAAVLQWVREWYETHIVYRFSGEPAKQDASYAPTWMPEGYQEKSASILPGLIKRVYQNEDQNKILMEYVPMQQGTAISAASETAEEESVQINGNQGTLYLESDPNQNSVLVWCDDCAGMAFTLSASLSREDILHIAESVKLSQSTK